MLFEFDPDKDALNRMKHGLGLAEAERLDWDAADIFRDNLAYAGGEVRYIAFAPLDGRLHAVWFTWRDNICRVIGIRKANRKEVRRYDEQD